MEKAQSDSAQRKRAFLGWQCRLRQIAVRDHGGRPSPGMVPRLRIEADGPAPESIVTLIVPEAPTTTTDQIRHICLSTHDPRSRYERGLDFLRTGYFQHPERFGDRMTTLFGPGSNAAATLLRAQTCVLEFDHYNQRFRIPCLISRLERDDAAWQATYWHNRLFNPRVPADSAVLGFLAAWEKAESDP